MKTICFVCTGNTCRSVMAEYIMKKYLKKYDLPNFKIISAGINVPFKDKTNDKTILALKKLKINARKKTAKQINKKIFDESFLILTMTKEQKEKILSNKTFTFGEMIDKTDIPDPYGLSQEEYDKTVKIIEEYVILLLEKMKLLKE